MKKIICDYHMHTPLCGHAVGEPIEYAQRAIYMGLKEIGFSDHAPLVTHRDPGVTMDFDQLPGYLGSIEALRDEMQDLLIVKVGIEADYAKGYEAKTKELLSTYPYDYVIGSVHYIESWAFDNPEEKTGWDHKDTNAIYREYYEHLRASAESGLFDIMGHVDLVKKFGHRATVDMYEEVHKTAEAFKASGVALEINSSGLRKPVAEIYPSLENLKIYAKAGVPLTFGSDAHAPNQVGCDFDQARELALEAGYKEYAIFEKRKIVKMVSLV